MCRHPRLQNEEIYAVRPNLLRIAAPLLVIGIMTAARPASATAQTGADSQAIVKTDPLQLRPDAARMYACVMKPHPGELKWQQIPWLTDLREAIRLAEEEKRPLLIFVSGDEPLEKC
jgi:hypothetical protein